MLAPSWSDWALGASMAALPCPRASTAGESAVAAAAWLLSGEEVRFSTIGSFLDLGALLAGASLSVRVWLPRRSRVVVAPQGLLIRRIGASQRSATGYFRLDPRLHLVVFV